MVKIFVEVLQRFNTVQSSKYENIYALFYSFTVEAANYLMRIDCIEKLFVQFLYLQPKSALPSIISLIYVKDSLELFRSPKVLESLDSILTYVNYI